MSNAPSKEKLSCGCGDVDNSCNGSVLAAVHTDHIDFLLGLSEKE